MSYVLAETLGKAKGLVLKQDSVAIDNYLFKLHHRANFVILSIGLAFTFYENYIDGDQMVCHGEVNDYAKKFCLLHGAGYVHENLQTDVTGRSCTHKKEEGDGHRLTAYYIWMPLILTLCMGVTKLPRMIWKHALEKGFMEKLVNQGENGEKIAESFNDIRKRNKFWIYNLSYAIAELLNVLAVFVNFSILNRLLNGMFWSYGLDVNHFLSLSPEEQKDIPDPMCNVFPTEVACNIVTGAISGGGKDKSSDLCILSMNIINQKFFLGLWWWWVILLTISCLGLVYRSLQISVSQISGMLLRHRLDQAALSNIEPTYWKLTSMSPSDLFVLSRIAQSVPKEVMTKVLTELRRMQKKGLSRTDTIAPVNNETTKENQKTSPDMPPSFNQITYKVKDESVGMDNKGLLD